MIDVVASDGTDVRSIAEGTGRPILVVHGGLNDPSDWAKVARCLDPRFRVVRLHRRQYRMDLTPDSPVTMAQEVDDVRALATAIGEPVLLVGHSSGAVVGLEAMVAAPALFAGAVLYEPPAITGPPLGGDALRAARAASAEGRTGKALAIFLRDIVRMPAWITPLAGLAVAVMPTLRPLVARQLDDCAAIDQLGLRLAAYAGIEVPTVFLRGERSPAHLGERIDVLARQLPHVEQVVTLPRQGHAANQRAPREVARVVEALADRIWSSSSP